MAFASALSEHPVAVQATGEVVGSVLEAMGDRPDLVVVAVTRPHAGALEDIVATVAAVLRPLVVVGAASGSVIGTGHQVAETPAISLWAGQVGPLAPLSLTATRLADDGWHFAGWPRPTVFEPTALVLLADPSTFPAAEFLSWLDEAHPGLPVVGGYVSGGAGAGGSRLVAGARVLTSGAVGVLVGAGVRVRTIVSQGCRPYGSPLTVTRSERNILYEVAGTPAIECLVGQIQRSLGPAEVAELESGGLLVGRLVDERVVDARPGDYLVRNVMGVDRSTGAVAVDGPVPVGSTVRFHLRDAASARDELALLLAGRHASAALLFPCHDRGARRSDGPDDARTLEQALGAVPVGGFASAGEFGPVGGRNHVHGRSASIALFDEH